ncbi:unnamed protein product, partial [Polarella glacialis]
MALQFHRESLRRDAPEVYDFWFQQTKKTSAELDHVFDHDWEILAGASSADFVDFPIWVAYLFVPLPQTICVLFNHRMGFGCSKRAQGICTRQHGCLYCESIPTARIPQQSPSHGMFLVEDPCLRKRKYDKEMSELVLKNRSTEKDVTQAIQRCMGATIWWRIRRPGIRSDPTRRDQLPVAMAVTNNAIFGDFVKVRSLLNKICPDNLKTIVERLATIELNKAEELEIVIRIIFQKALAEPHYCETYADMVFALRTRYPEFRP